MKETQLIPEKELITDQFRWFIYPEELTGLRLVGLEDLSTGLIVTTTLANSEKRTAAHRAWAGARHSRAPGAPWEIMNEMGKKGIDPDQKLDDTFRNYGHKSVGDMAGLEISTHNMPMHLCFALFNNATINGGQEKSSRYQSKFHKATLHPLLNYLPTDFPSQELSGLETEYQGFGQLSLNLYAQHRDRITPDFAKFYQVEPEQSGVLNSRVMDCVRFFLLFGQCSGMSLSTPARDWSRIVSELKGSPLAFYQKTGYQIEQLFAPTKEIEESLQFKAEAPSLIRHSEPSTLTSQNIGNLHAFIKDKTDFLNQVPINKKFLGYKPQSVELITEEFSEAEKMIAQYLLTSWPGANKDSVLSWVQGQNEDIKREISKIVFAGHNHNHELPLWAGTSSMTLVLRSYLGEDRDWNRHRAWRRFVSLPLIYGEQWSMDTATQIINQGFGLPLYLTEIDEFSKLGSKFSHDLELYYNKLSNFIKKMNLRYGTSMDYSFVLNLLPLAHQVDLWMHGDPKQALYLTHLRSRPGGHINYRDLAYKANHLIANSDPYLEGLRLSVKPNPQSREEFLNRS